MKNNMQRLWFITPFANAPTKAKSGKSKRGLTTQLLKVSFSAVAEYCMTVGRNETLVIRRSFAHSEISYSETIALLNSNTSGDTLNPLPPYPLL